MDEDVAGVRISPPVVEFIDADVNEPYRTSLIVQNVSKFSKRIRFHGPITEKFKLNVTNPQRPVAPGMEIFATVEYISDVAEDARDRIILSVDDDVIEIPLYAYTPTPLLDLESPVDFGMVVANSRVVSQEVAVINHGSMDGKFSISYTGSLPIVIIPTSGSIAPKTIQLVKVELITEAPGKFAEFAEVKLEGMKDTKLEIKGCVVEQSLQLFASNNQSPLKCVTFGPAYYGTDRIEPAYLFNNGPEPIKWVSVLEEGADGEEAGTDLTKSTAAMLATSPAERIRGRAYDILTSLITVFPNQGAIGPYQKVPVYFRFSPRFNSSSVGWEATEKPPPRQDFALFMMFEIVGSNDSFLSDVVKPNKKIEVAVTATAIPVLINIQPSNTFDFGEVLCGDHSSVLCTLTNESALLPLNIKCKKVAHFNVIPAQAKISPGSSQDIMISFQPNQAGTFDPLQMIDVLGKVCDEDQDNADVTKLSVKPFQTVPIQLIGSSIAIPRGREPRVNPGITPLVTNETGQFVDITFDDMKRVKGQLRPTVINANNALLHLQNEVKTSSAGSNARVAFPNDRAQSIRPSRKDEEYQTPFTRSKRHTYVDPDYTYTIGEEEARRHHKQKYAQFLRDCASKRQQKNQTKEYNELNNDTDVDLKPAVGLKPPSLSAKEIESPAPYQKPPLHEKHRLLTTRQLANQERKAITRPVSEGLNAVPITSIEKMDCKRELTPQDLHKVVIGPPTIDFGEVCLRSTNHKQLHIVNNLDHYILVQVTIDCKELRQTSPLSQVIPAQSKAQFTLVFESNTQGKFQRSISYSVNSQHESHVLVLARIIPVALELSCNDLELTPEAGVPAEAGYRSTVTLYNRRNYPAEFTWSPILTDRGTAFSIRPATGTVEAYKDLNCKVVFHPSYFAPLEGDFHMQVHNGNSMKLNCLAKLGATNVQFVERRILFGSVPLNMKTTRTALLHNSGNNHAMFYVINSNPFPGMTVSPVHGIVPVGGNAELKIVLSPTAVVKFDTWIQVNIRGWKTIDLRMGGTVEPPEVDIDIKAFKFHGVYCNSVVAIPFNLVNYTTTRVKAEFDLTKYSDFTLEFPEEQLEDDPGERELLSPNTYAVELVGQQTLACVLNFNPTSVASYDFNLPVVINKTGAPSPTPSTFPPTPVPSEKHIVTPRPVIITIPTPRRRVVATALRPTLQLSTSRLNFSLPVSFMEMSVPDNAGGDQQFLILSNKSDSPLSWELDVNSVKNFVEDSAFTFLKPGGAWYSPNKVAGTLNPRDPYQLRVIFCPKKVGSYVYNIPLILNDDKEKPYRHLTLNAMLQAPNITFDPLALVLTPVPLATAVYAEFNVIASGYVKTNILKIDVPDVEADDGTKITCFALEFPNGSTIPGPKSTALDEKVSVNIPCVLTFSSHTPVSATVDIVLTDEAGRKFCLPVTATADNCLLTVYPFLAAHRNDHQIVCEQDKSLRGPSHDANSASLGEAVLVPCVSPQRPSTRGSTSATSSHFGTASSSFDESSNAASESEYGHSSRDGAQPAIPAHSDTTGTGTSHRGQGAKNAVKDAASLQKTVSMSAKNTEDPSAQRELMSRSLGSAVFPFESSAEAHFHQEVLLAAQRWISAHGWPGGPFPVTVPQTLRCLVTRIPYDDDDTGVSVKKEATANGKGAKGTMGGWDTNLKKDVKTIYDMLQHLCGRLVPGIPINQPLPRDPTERVLQLHWQHSTLLTFLRGQGASVSAIRPEFLLTPREYRRWVKIRERETKRDDKGKLNQSEEVKQVAEEKASSASAVRIEEELFESVSKRAWTDLLLQLFKVLVLSRITPSQYNKMKPIHKGVSMPKINVNPLVSNVYSVGERIVLAWLNHHYGQQRHIVWGNRRYLPSEKCKGGLPPSRWVVNFDYDLLDGLVLAAVVSAYCPWLINEYFSEMYTAPASPEQCLHNTLILVRALRKASIDYDVQATDITDPNPIALLLLCVYLYQNLPQYVPKSKIHFVGPLHSTVRRQVRITNPSVRALKYIASISGRDAADFKLPGGEEVNVPLRGDVSIDVQFTSRLLRPADAVLVLVGRRDTPVFGYSRPSGTIGSTLVFTIKTSIDDIHPSKVIRADSPCYELKKIDVPITNPFPNPGAFRIVLVESCDGPPSPLDIGRRHGIARSTRKTLSSRIKSVKSRIDHGQPKESLPPATPPSEDFHVPDEGKVTSAGPTMTSQLTAFYCHQSHISLNVGQSSVLQLDFLPFTLGRKFCSILLVDENVGEFLYAVEAVSSLPLPSVVPFNFASKHSVRITSAAAARRGKGLFGGDDRVVYWKCENNGNLVENLLIPVTNDSKERALRVAAKQRMSKKEQERRSLTGTLESGTVTAAIAAMGLVDNDLIQDQENCLMPPTSAPPRPAGVTFKVEASSEWFEVPSTITVPSPMTFGPPPATEMISMNAGPNDRQDDGIVPLEVRFTPKGPGHYPCDIALKSPNDVRVYRVECTVNSVGTTARLDFHAPAHQSITQSIPIQNTTKQDWKMDCIVEADGFEGPKYLFAKAGQTAYYKLMFKPHYECTVAGRLIIQNRCDGTEHLFNLFGVGESPLSLEHIIVPCKCREATTRTVTVPNYAPHKLTYKVMTDIPCLEGDALVTVLKGETAEYKFTLLPWQRGVTTGMLAFTVDDMEKARSFDKDDSDSDKDDLVSTDQSQTQGYESKTPSFLTPQSSQVTGLSGYRVWYSIEVQAEPADPVDVINVECPVQGVKEIEIPVKNPSGERVEYDVDIIADLVEGDAKFVLAPRIPAVYRLRYQPREVGRAEGSVIFCSPHTGEFWYKLKFDCVPPSPKHLPAMECHLGRWTRQYITLSNTTDETMTVEAGLSNNVNFSLDIPLFSSVSVDSDNPKLLFKIPAQSKMEIPVQFMPTNLGAASHQTTITFKSKQLGEVCYLVSGRGLAPQTMEPLSVSAGVGSSTSLILPFRNPTDAPVLVDVNLSDNDHTMNSISASVIRNNITVDSAFCLLLKHTTNIRLEPRQTLDIPFTFSPDKMRRHEGALSISLSRDDGEAWPEENAGMEDFTGLGRFTAETEMGPLSRADDGSVKAIRWVFPVHGIPEVRSKETKEAILQCQARSRIEERLEVTLTGAVPSSASGHDLTKLRAVTPLDRQRSAAKNEGVVVEGHSIAEEFSYAIDYPEHGDVRQQIEQALAVSLVRKQRNPHTGMVVLVFNLVFSPFRPMNYTVCLTVASATGGVWSFPLSIRASEPPPDDVIYVEAAGLGKGSTVSFLLYSHSKHPTPFNAFFVNGSDLEFSVSPATGELQPQGTSGTRLSVTFTPNMYGRFYKARLIVQTLDMQWTYDVKGVTPEYRVPNVSSTILHTTPSRPRAIAQRPRVNYVRKNLRLNATAVSSPIKGTRLLNRITTQ
ncbi:cilia- and flagella-associated protein 47-like isoform X2 [Clavelina lepadiformis]|uniref:cilia- and flagella-associated protein 47-like isoform X2 n=1 Tax=Clavelina lepadiformis TaxID=159417 RepID=UPI004043435D